MLGRETSCESTNFLLSSGGLTPCLSGVGLSPHPLQTSCLQPGLWALASQPPASLLLLRAECR